MKKTPVATIMREELNRVALWRPGISVTYQDTSYTRTKQTKRWASKYLDFELKFSEKDCKKLKNRILRRIKEEGHKVDHVSNLFNTNYGREVLVYQTTPIKVTVLG